jgi:hypothetical protein
MTLAAKYQKETNPLPTFKYEIIRLAADKNSCEVLESYNTLQKAVDKHKTYTETDIKINLRPENDR